MKTFAIALVGLVGFLCATTQVQAQRKFDVPPHQGAGWSGPIGAPPKKDKDKDNPKKDKDKDNPKKDKDNPKKDKDKDNPKKDKDDPKKDRDQRLKDKQNEINNALGRGRSAYQRYKSADSHSAWVEYWRIVLDELPRLEGELKSIQDEKP